MKQLPAPPEDAEARLAAAIRTVVSEDRHARIEFLARQLSKEGIAASKVQPSTARKDLRKIRSLIAQATRLERSLPNAPLDLEIAARHSLSTLRSEMPTFICLAERVGRRLVDEIADEHGGIFVKAKTGPGLALWWVSCVAAVVYTQASGKRPRRSVRTNADTQDNRERGNFVLFLKAVFSALGIDPKKAPRAAKDILSDLRDSPLIVPDASSVDMDQSVKS